MGAAGWWGDLYCNYVDYVNQQHQQKANFMCVTRWKRLTAYTSSDDDDDGTVTKERNGTRDATQHKIKCMWEQACAQILMNNCVQLLQLIIIS